MIKQSKVKTEANKNKDPVWTSRNGEDEEVEGRRIVDWVMLLVVLLRSSRDVGWRWRSEVSQVGESPE